MSEQFCNWRGDTRAAGGWDRSSRVLKRKEFPSAAPKGSGQARRKWMAAPRLFFTCVFMSLFACSFSKHVFTIHYMTCTNLGADERKMNKTLSFLKEISLVEEISNWCVTQFLPAPRRE